jgi:VIT1/CCC1 family predicted Fe2+/Mn2+ transporter
MKQSLKSGFGFGITSGIVTTLGLIVGLSSGTHSELAVIGGILSIAIADGLSESMSMHVSRKSENRDRLYIWESTIATLFAKFIVTMSFAIPVLLTNLQTAVMIDIGWGLFLLVILSFLVSEYEGRKKWKDILEHLLVAILVVALSYGAGEWINARFY